MDLNGNPVNVPRACIPELPRSGEWKRPPSTALGLRAWEATDSRRAQQPASNSPNTGPGRGT